jgi:hypothetical protein
MLRAIVLLLLVAAAAGAHPLDMWHWRNPLPQGNPLRTVVHGNGIYVAVGGRGTIMTSSDGTNWTRRVSGTSDHLNSVTYANRQFVAVGSAGTIVTSPDGLLWTPQYGGTFFSLNGVAFGNGMYVVVGQNNTILTSLDGVLWVSRSSGPFHLTDVAYGNNIFVAVGSALLTSPDGLNWFRQALEPALGTIAFGGGLFVGAAGGSFEGGSIWTSVDGSDWRQQNSTEGEVRDIAYGSGRWVAVAGRLDYSDGFIYSSSNAIDWVQAHTNATPVQGVGFGTGRFVATLDDGTVLLSENGLNWANPLRRPLDVLYGWRDMTYGPNGFVAVGPYVAIASSSNGVTWTDWPSPTNVEPYVEFQSIAYGNGLYVAGATSRPLWVSADLINWTNPAPTLSVDTIDDIIYANHGFVAVSGSDGVVLSSPDGIRWTLHELPPVGYWYLQAVAHGNGVYVLAARDRLAASRNLTNWHVSDMGSAAYARGVAYGNGRFVVVGSGPVLVSEDATNWVRTAYISHLQNVAFGGGYFVAVGGETDFPSSESSVWSSQDGATWTRHSIFGGQALPAVTYGNGSFVTGGYRGGILQSDPLIALSLSMNPVAKLTISGPNQRTYEIEYSDQVIGWRRLTSAFAESIPMSLTDATATNSTRFYRAVLKESEND